MQIIDVHLVLDGFRTVFVRGAVMVPSFNATACHPHSETGGVVVWRAADTAGTPPPDLAQRFPGLVPEVPRAFDWLVNGRLPTLRIGWAILRPKGQ